MTEEEVVRLYRAHMCFDAMDELDDAIPPGSITNCPGYDPPEAPRIVYVIAPGNYGLPCA